MELNRHRDAAINWLGYEKPAVLEPTEP